MRGATPSDGKRKKTTAIECLHWRSKRRVQFSTLTCLHEMQNLSRNLAPNAMGKAGKKVPCLARATNREIATFQSPHLPRNPASETTSPHELKQNLQAKRWHLKILVVSARKCDTKLSPNPMPATKSTSHNMPRKRKSHCNRETQTWRESPCGTHRTIERRCHKMLHVAWFQNKTVQNVPGMLRPPKRL